MQPGVVICIEIEECDLVLTDYANAHPAESPGTVRAWANAEGMVPDECPGHSGMFVLSPRTPNEAFAIRMRWG